MALGKMVEDVSLQLFFIEYLFDSIFLGIVCIVKLHSCVEGICFNIKQGNTKKKLFDFHGNGC